MYSRISYPDTNILSGGYSARLDPSLMGSKLSYMPQNYFNSPSSENGKYPKNMGTGASNFYEGPNNNSRYQGKKSSFSLPNKQCDFENDYSRTKNVYDDDRRSPSSTRPLPSGPGPVFPKGIFGFNKKKQDSATKIGKGPMKADHLLPQKGISSRTDDRSLCSPIDHRSLSRLKSKSLDDVRGRRNSYADKPNADKPMTDVNMRKAKKSFRISRSPSHENISVGRGESSSDQRALLDKMSKLRTDQSTAKRTSYVDLQNKTVPNVHSFSKGSDFGSKTLSSTYRSSNSRTDLGSDIKSSKVTTSLKDSKPERIQALQKQAPVSRKLSDSAYESGSSSGRSSPGVFKEHSTEVERKSNHNGKGLVGLRNLGNTCFMNSILQCLRCSRKLRDIMCAENYMEQKIHAAPRNKGGLAKALSDVVREMWSEHPAGATVSPYTLKSQVQRYAPRFVGYSQQDSQEFLRFLLEGLHDDLNMCTEKVKGHYPDMSKYSEAEQARIAWEIYEKREKSLISDLFVGQLKSTLTCTECNYRSLTFDPFWDLSLPIPNRTRSSLATGKVSLDDCFKRFTQEETLDGDEKPTCEMCKKRRKCLKQFSIERFPQILVLHLKRFSGMRYRTKLETLVDFPFELNLLNYAAKTASERCEAQYTLLGVSNHSGGTYSGHYTAHVKHPDLNEWFYYSDSTSKKRALYQAGSQIPIENACEEEMQNANFDSNDAKGEIDAKKTTSK